MKTQYEMLEAKLNAAHAVITEVQNLMRLMHENGLLSFKDEARGAAPTGNAQKASAKADSREMGSLAITEGFSESEACLPHVSLTQGELFGDERKDKEPNETNGQLRQRVENIAESSSSRDANAEQIRATSPRMSDLKRVRHRGEPSVDRKTAMQNFRDIVKGREIIHLADVNRIFGYNESTSGHFVRDAVKDGRLQTIDYGNAGRKFLARAVRDFIKSYFDAADGMNDK